MLSIVDTNYTTPNNSLLIDYHFQYQAINSHKITFTCDYWLYGEPDTLNLDIYNNSQPHAFEFHLNDADDQAYKINAFQIPATDGWYTLKKSLNNFGSTFNYPCKLTKIILYLVQNGAIVGNIYSGSILLDNLGICNDVLSLIDHKNEQVNEFQLFQNYPNPFNPTTMIKYSIAIEGLVELKIYNILGEEITTLINENKNAGNYSIEFNGQDLSSGVYFYRIKSGKFTEIKKMILMK
ncbi:MAG: T9SS type A sorting domain-containing protein [Ignavibacteriales bacterium]|nr:T9SS type A sorting domain-containing protein [Ignavibacteriales bacterium]